MNIQNWLLTAEPGERITYHQGHLARDRHDHGDRLAIPGLDELATAVLAASDRREVVLLQRRLGEDAYEYLCVKLPERAAQRRAA